MNLRLYWRRLKTSDWEHSHVYHFSSTSIRSDFFLPLDRVARMYVRHFCIDFNCEPEVSAWGEAVLEIPTLQPLACFHAQCSCMSLMIYVQHVWVKSLNTQCLPCNGYLKSRFIFIHSRWWREDHDSWNETICDWPCRVCLTQGNQMLWCMGHQKTSMLTHGRAWDMWQLSPSTTSTLLERIEESINGWTLTLIW